MEIGGYDTEIDTDRPLELAKEICDFVNWPDAVIEKADDFPGEEEDFFYYENQAARDEVGAEPALENTMIYFLIREGHLSVVTDKELTDKIRSKYNADAGGQADNDLDEPPKANGDAADA